MASRGNNDVYEIMDKFKNNFVFSETLSERLKCFICQKVLVNAKQTSCGCKGCDKCFISLLKDGPQNCPSKQADCKDVIDMGLLCKDNATNKDIRALKVECPNEGCKKIIEIKELPNHFNDCQFRLVICEKCDKDYQFNLKNVHLNDKCSKRNFKCEWCNKLIVYDEYEKDHLNFNSENLCSEYVDNCPNKCEVMEKVKIKQHLRNCGEFKMKCPYHKLGCKDDKISNKELSEHLSEYDYKHIEKLVDDYAELEKMFSVYKDCTKDLKSYLKESIKKKQERTKLYFKLVETNKKLKSQKRLQSPPSSLSTNESSNANNVVIFRDGSLIWKITNYSSKREQALEGSRLSWTSDPFYTSQFGYKMCLRIYPAGDGAGHGSFLSVFFALMKGDYDNLLPWPFKQKVVISLLDQSGAGKHNTDTFKPDARSACYQQPHSDSNVASGSPKFFLLSNLMASNEMFLKNDTLFLKITIDSYNLYKP